MTIDPSSGVPVFNLSGNELSQSPNYTVDLAVEYVVHLSHGTITLRGESNWSDRVYFTPFNRDAVSQPAYNLQNAFVTYDSGDKHWRVALFAKNIGDKTIRSSAQISSSIVGSPIVGFLQPPRTYGATLGYRF